ncbi:MAG: 30S ribosomal protein S12 methylthiotransferase RimO [Candidatus Eremiobacteraeota bacterium]|nr:30S ribosomal protein S12 methylthiotransferase RimO [Candidatus Eremiobacteraeota bacterium]
MRQPVDRARRSAPRRAFLASLGCAKNLVDSEVMLGRLAGDGWEITAQASDADAVIVNTCAFIDPAKAESTDTILEYAAAKREGQRLIVAGCLAQRYGPQLRELIPEIDAIVGTGAFPKIPEIMREADAGLRPLHLEDRDAYVERLGFLPRVVTTHRATAYLKISEGCNHTCSFCIIPALRGMGKSRTIASLVAEAQALAKGGAKELVLVAQDSSDYGRDIELKDGLARLIEALEDVDGIRWIRILYLYPTSVTPAIVAAMRASSKVVPYVDMPLQHAHPDILRAMHRPPQPERYLELLASLRDALPSATIRSTFIVGFPSESEAHFNALLNFLERAQLDRVGFFAYSREEGTRACDAPEQIPERTKKRRLTLAREVQRRISDAIEETRIGERVDILIEGKRLLAPSSALRELGLGRLSAVGRSQREAPGVDGLVYLPGEYPVGEFVAAHIVGHTEFDRAASALEPAAAR